MIPAGIRENMLDLGLELELGIREWEKLRAWYNKQPFLMFCPPTRFPVLIILP